MGEPKKSFESPAGPQASDRRAAVAYSRLPELFELWHGFYDATTPVSQADALVQFGNAIYHLEALVRGEDGSDPADV